MSTDRRQQAHRVRVEAATLARERTHPAHVSNGDEHRYASAGHAMSFTKGLEHAAGTGLVADPLHFEAFRAAIDGGEVDAFTREVPTGANCWRKPTPDDRWRAWEAPTAGLVHDLEGPDSQAVTMPPAPALGSDELAYEMAEVYELALLRDVPLSAFAAGNAASPVQESVDRLNALSYCPDGRSGRPRQLEYGSVTRQTAFRGSSPGVTSGPYLSQFMVIGNEGPCPLPPCSPNCEDDNDALPPGALCHGLIGYGPQTIDQRVPVAAQRNWMIDFDDWLDVQQGKDVRDNATLFDCSAPRRFITTPRDLATYVHDDALYQAYLNACLILLSMGAPTDPGFDRLSGAGRFLANRIDVTDGRGTALPPTRQAAGFALWGGPHILTLVTEVATRALKAVRYQKFNNHIRLRPEALAARIEKAAAIEAAHPRIGSAFSDLRRDLNATVGAVIARNTADGHATALLPMAFQEGSPMHPSYGAGHATVAGACVTVLKAFFDTSAVLSRRHDPATGRDVDAFRRPSAGDQAIQYVVDPGADCLRVERRDDFLTLEGELNKLAANISIGRNMGGVHYYSDYHDSLRMGESIAIGMLEEQALCYPTDRFVLDVPTYDGGSRRIGAR